MQPLVCDLKVRQTAGKPTNVAALKFFLRNLKERHLLLFYDCSMPPMMEQSDISFMEDGIG